MDYDSDSSDFHFPSDTGLPKLSSPLDYKVPESHDWALEEFLHTLQDKPCSDVENLLSFKQYIPVEDEESDDEYYPTTQSRLPEEEEDVLKKLSHHFIQLERMELHDILKGGFSLVQNDIQSNTKSHSPPGLSWFDEANTFGGQSTIVTLDSIKPEQKKEFNRSLDYYATTVSLSNQPMAVAQEKPLPALPPILDHQVTQPKKKSGLKSKIKSKFFHSSDHSITEKPKKSFYHSTKKFIRKILTVS